MQNILQCIFLKIVFISIFKNAILFSEKVVTMGNDPQSINFRRGLLPIIILQLLQEKDMYGYQLVQETGRRSHGRIITQEGSLYPVLYRLVAGGYLSERKVPRGEKMIRVYYHLEESGREYLEKLIEEYDFISQGMRYIMGREE